jgi:alpha-L-rhamnosidase
MAAAIHVGSEGNRSKRLRHRNLPVVGCVALGAAFLSSLGACRASESSRDGTAEKGLTLSARGEPSLAGDAKSSSAPSAPTDLTVGDRARPLNVEGAPVFAWRPHDGPNELQTAYQIVVTRDGDPAVVWDSGKVASSEQAYVGYAGPSLANQSSYSWSVRTWDRDGQASPWAERSSFDTGLADVEWEASWIRRNSVEPDDYTLARREFTVGASRVTRARAYVAASHQYELSLNGAVVDRGPCFAYPGEGYYQATDVTAQVQAGQPLAMGVIYHWYGPGQGRPAAERGLLVRVVIEHADGSREVVVTDDTWRMARATQWETGTAVRNGDAGDYTERVDARQRKPGWNLPGYDASGPEWGPPEVFGRHPAGVFTHLVGQDSRISSTLVSPVSVQALPDGSVVADFGRVMSARPLLHFEAGSAGRSLSIVAGYRLLADGHVSTAALDTQGSNLSLNYIQADGAQDFEAFTHFAWRYLQLAAPGEPLGANTLRAIAEHVDVPLARAATFDSSNETLDAVFELVRHSALHSAAYQFVDTPTREKGQFLADAMNISFATMAGYSERDLTQQALVQFANSQARYWPDGRVNAVYPNGDGRRDIPDFTEMYPGWVSRYYLSTGDRALLARLYPVLENIAHYVLRYRSESTGLITNLAGGSGPYQFGIVDWPASGRFGYDMATSARTTVNVLAVDVLRNVAAAAQTLDHPAEADAYLQRAAELTSAINRRLRRADGLYVDGLDANGAQSLHASQHANSYPLAYAVAPREDHARLAAYVASLGMQQGPMTAHALLQALTVADRVDDVITRLTDSAGPGWANVLAHGGTFTWESWAPVATESYSHGWGSQALVDFSETLLGVRATSPGAATIAIVVPRTTLASARGSVPTERGPVAVDWRRSASGGLSLAVDVPVNVRAEVSLPLPEGATHSGSGDGAPAALGVEAGRARYAVGSGRSVFEVRR